jgi:hypothetical protein
MDTEILLSRIEDPELRDYYNFAKIVIQTRINLKLLKRAARDYLANCSK